MKDVNILTYECINELFSIGLEPGNLKAVTVNTRAKNRYGQCRKQFDRFTINISAFLLADNLPDWPAKNTIMHELIHTMPGCFNHGDAFKAKAEKINNGLGYKIKRCSNYEDMGIDRGVMFKYRFKCEKCGADHSRQRRSNFTEHPELYRCRCGGRIISQ